MPDRWSFDQSPNAAAVTTRQVLDGAPILSVTHYSDDHSWAFTCGSTDDERDARVVAMQEILAIDPSLELLADLLPGWTASRRSEHEQWQRAASNDV